MALGTCFCLYYTVYQRARYLQFKIYVLSLN